MATRDYSSLETIKEYIMGTVAPKFYDLDNVNDLNFGLLGMTTEVNATSVEDVFNTLSMYVKEAFPAQAQLPETIYSNASFLDISDIFAKPANIVMTIFVKESDIIKYGEAGASQIEFVLDSNMKIDVDGYTFMPDYDIHIIAKPHRGDHIFTAQYSLKYPNSISSITIPYLKSVRTVIDNVNYLGIAIKAHQVERFYREETVINNDVINFTSIDVEYEDYLAGFDVFYKDPNSNTFTLLTKKMYGSIPMKNPFCFYKLKTEGSYEVSFTMMDGYFQPTFNSEIKIVTYTTKGSDGNFGSYTGDKISVVPSNDVYDYNGNIVVFAIPQGASTNGEDKLSLEDLRYKIVEKWATSGAYTSENDLQSYLNNYSRASDTHVTFVKKRDDIVERLFSSFSLFKSKTGDYYHTNTLYMEVQRDEFDTLYQQDGRGTINAGSIFGYKDSSIDTCHKITGKRVGDDVSNLDFAYTNPFAISIQKSPTVIGYYLNSISEKIDVDYAHTNLNSYYQFIMNNFRISRNAVMGENAYKINMNLIPATSIDAELLKVPDGATYPILIDKIKVLMSITEDNVDLCYIDMNFVNYDTTTGVISYEGSFVTDDTITNDERILFLDVKDPKTSLTATKTVPMIDCVAKTYVLFNYEPEVIEYDKTIFAFPGYENFTLTNVYSTQTSPINFMVPMDIIRSRAKFMPLTITNADGSTVDSYYYLVDLVPLVRHDVISTPEKFEEFVTMLHDLHKYLKGIMDEKTNNYNIDMKFYNTYGRSKNFTVGEDDEQLDRVNIRIHFKISATVGADVETLIPRIKSFIKDYTEDINTSIDDNVGMKGYNAIYISNLIQELENNFEQIKYLKFVNINNYTSDVQVIENKTGAFSTLTQGERRSYVPEFLTIDEDDINIELLYK